VNKLAAVVETHADLLKEYRIALGMWSEARALYPSDSPEIERATEHLGILEYQLTHSSPPVDPPLGEKNLEPLKGG
jgi:hypothetical protein